MLPTPPPSFSFSDTSQRDYRTFLSVLSSCFSPSSHAPTINWTFQSTASSINHILPLHSTLCSKQYISEVRPIEGGLGESIANTIPPTLEDPSLPPPPHPFPWDGNCYIVKVRRMGKIDEGKSFIAASFFRRPNLHSSIRSSCSSCSSCSLLTPATVSGYLSAIPPTSCERKVWIWAFG